MYITVWMFLYMFFSAEQYVVCNAIAIFFSVDQNVGGLQNVKRSGGVG